MNQDIINITAVARLLKATTPAARRRLDRLGVTPLQEIPMPSGRTYVVYNKDTVQNAILRFEEEKSKAVARAERPQPERQQLMSEIQGLKEQIGMILEGMKRPQAPVAPVVPPVPNVPAKRPIARKQTRKGKK